MAEHTHNLGPDFDATGLEAYEEGENNILRRQAGHDNANIARLARAVEKQADSIATLSGDVRQLTVEMSHYIEAQKEDATFGQENRRRIEALERGQVSQKDFRDACDRLTRLELWQARVIGIVAAGVFIEPIILFFLAHYWSK